MAAKVLLVEDDRALREALSDTLLLGGHEFVAVDSAEAALPVLAREAFSLVISDVNMPGMDGHQLLGLIRTRYPHLPVLLMTAYGAVDRAVEAMRQGAADYLVAVRGAGAARPGGAPCAGPVAGQRGGWSGGSGAGQPAVAGTGRAGRAQRFHRADLRRVRDRQGSPGQLYPPAIAACRQAVHRDQLRGDPDNMLGHPVRPRGSFTGAIAAQPGKFELADGGTILLDEISECPSACRPSCCAYCRSARWSGSVRANRSTWISACLPRPTATSRRKSRRAFPRGPLLSPVGSPAGLAAAARTPCGHPAAGRAPAAQAQPQDEPRRGGARPRGRPVPGPACLAGQRTGTRQRHPACVDPATGRPDPARRPVPHRADRHTARGPGAGAHAGNATGHPAERRDSVAGRRPGR